MSGRTAYLDTSAFVKLSRRTAVNSAASVVIRRDTSGTGKNSYSS